MHTQSAYETTQCTFTSYTFLWNTCMSELQQFITTLLLSHFVKLSTLEEIVKTRDYVGISSSNSCSWLLLPFRVISHPICDFVSILYQIGIYSRMFCVVQIVRISSHISVMCHIHTYFPAVTFYLGVLHIFANFTNLQKHTNYALNEFLNL